VKHFRYFLEGCHFTIFADHKPLTYAITSSLDRHNPREARHLDFIAGFTTDIRYVAGSANIAADALSRPNVNILGQLDVVPLSLQLAEAQQADEELQRFCEHPGSLDLRPVTLPDFATDLICDVSGSRPRPLFYGNKFLTLSTTFRIPEVMPLVSFLRIAMFDQDLIPMLHDGPALVRPVNAPKFNGMRKVHFPHARLHLSVSSMFMWTL